MQDEGPSAQSEQHIATALVRRIAAGDRGAESELVQRYARGLLLMLTARTRDRQLAADLRQDAFIIAIEKLRQGSLAEPEKLAGYLTGIARNLAIADMRKQIRRKTNSDTDYLNYCADEQQSHYESLAADETAKLVRRLLGELRVERDREILTRVYVYDEDKEQVCAELGLDSLHFNRVLFRAKRRLRELIDHDDEV